MVLRRASGMFRGSLEMRQEPAKIEAVGLRFLGCHIFLDQYDSQTMVAPMDMVKTIADGAASLGAQRLILSGGGLIRDGKVDQEALKRKAEGLNAAGKYAKSKGLRLAYHNHGPEFEKGGLEIEGLYRLTDPGLVDFLTDCGWAFRTGTDVPGFFTRHHKRIIGMHLRDFKTGTQVPLGQGDFPLKEIAAAVNKANWSGWVINEEERLRRKAGREGGGAGSCIAQAKSFGR
ncbi:MAG: TIM barrel protein [Acidobacteria bacterium]|nr:TIM barrel protein [Acidobacteriota bacterium]